MAIAVKPNKQSVAPANVEQSAVKTEKKGLFKKKTEVVEKKKVEGFLEGSYLLDTTSKDPGYVGMLRVLAKAGSPVTPLTTSITKSKFSTFIDKVLEEVRSVPIDIGSSEVQEIVQPSSGKKKVEVKFL